MDIEPSARKHGARYEDMLHTLGHHLPAFETGDCAVTMFGGPTASAELLGINVVDDEVGTVINHAVPARSKFRAGRCTP